MTIERTEPPMVLPERDMLESWLDYHRATLLHKCDGLDDDQLRIMSVEPSNMSLLGLVRHMTEVERNWFSRVLAQQDAPPLYYDDADEDGDFTRIADADVAGDHARFLTTCDASRAIAGRHDLDDTGTRRGEPVSLRWIMVHMIEEYARHNGHADLLRERIDGSTGD
jgi:uncharacterized damage-inducible protein DinB